MQHSAQAAREALAALEKESADMARRLRNARAADARARFDAAHGQYDPWTVQGAEDDVATLEARATALPGLIQKARVWLAETELEEVDTELQELEAGEAERQDALSTTAADLRRARDAHDAAREADSAARQRVAAIRSGIKPHRENVVAALINDGS